MSKQFPGVLEDFGEVFDLSSVEADVAIEHYTVTLWIPTDYKEKFNILQSRSRKRFGKFLKSIVMKHIDQAFAQINDQAS